MLSVSVAFLCDGAKGISKLLPKKVLPKKEVVLGMRYTLNEGPTVYLKLLMLAFGFRSV